MRLIREVVVALGMVVAQPACGGLRVFVLLRGEADEHSLKAALLRQGANFFAHVHGCGAADERRSNGDVMDAEHSADSARGDARELHDVTDRFLACVHCFSSESR
jgi:hypothetical protein